ncbi:MAG: serine hydrolase domain-containing protein [Verrucomicrobiota bacterium]
MKTPDYSAGIAAFESLARAEVEQGRISGVSVAFVDDQRIVYAQAFGCADKAKGIPATTNTVYRAGSISKLFTAVATMQLAEQGKLDIDAPVTKFNRAFRIVNPFEGTGEVTLRQLMCHRSGMIRESPVGSYFDDSGATVDETVASLAGCALVNPPGAKMRYSNVGVTVVGQTVERVSGLEFEAYQQRHLFGPLGMRSSSFWLGKSLKPYLSKAYLPVADGKGGFREIEAPQFELGTIPAGNLYTTAADLGRFLSCLFAEGRTAGGKLLKPDTLKEMFTPQLTKETNTFGIGFSLGTYRRYKTIGHGGAVYGFSSTLLAIPSQKIGVVLLNNDDINGGPVRKLTEAALDLLLEAKTGERFAKEKKSFALADATPFTGEFESESYWASVASGQGKLLANISGQRMEFIAIGTNRFEAFGRVVHASPVVFEKDAAGRMIGFSLMGQTFRRVDMKQVRPIPQLWRSYLGSYGKSFIPAIVSERNGHLYVMTENMWDYRLTPVNETVFKMPVGMYTDEHLTFEKDAKGRVHGLVLANVKMQRRSR